MTWTKRRPTEPGYFWFRANEDSPRTLSRDEPAIVIVAEDPETNRIGVRFGHMQYDVRELAGYFAGPIELPEEY